jgi:hypothetical protein
MKKALLVLALNLTILLAAACGKDENTSASTPNRSEPSRTETVPPTSATAYSLDWNIGDGEVVAYDTTMQAANPTISFNFDDLVAAMTTDELPADVTEQLSNLSFSLPESGSLISILERNAQGNIAVKMIPRRIDLPDESSNSEMGQALGQAMESMVGTVQLRGELNPDGAITSFYLEQKQRNLLAMFFELPTGPVQVGDSWSIDVNCIEMGNGFIASSAQRTNRVEFTELSKTPDGRPIAVLDYVIAEFVRGEFLAPTSDDVSPASMMCMFIGRGEFLIEEGRWERFTGEFTVRSTGFMEANATQRFALTPLEEVPPEYLNLR